MKKIGFQGFDPKVHLKGSMPAIVTPFKKCKIDFEALSSLATWLVNNGSRAIVAVGTTGESATLKYNEHFKVIRAVIEALAGTFPVIAGTGANSTDETIIMTKQALKDGADAALLVAPYYNKPTQEGLYLHYKAVAEAVPDLPLILYNVPSRTAVNITPTTVLRLIMECKNIIAIKEASGDMKQVAEIIQLCGDRLIVLSGDDFTTLPLMALGGKGAISVTANIRPSHMAELCDVMNKKDPDLTKARQINNILMPINSAMFIETNPIPVKTALAMMGKIKEEFRLPLCPMSHDNRMRLERILRNNNVI